MNIHTSEIEFLKTEVQRLRALVRAQQITIDKLEAQLEQKPVAWMTISPFGDEDDIWYANPEGQLREGWTYKALYEEPPKQNPLTSIDYVPCCTDQTCPKCKATTPPQRKPLTGEQEREAFEAWALGTICYKEDLQRKEITGYGSQELNYLWRGWSAKAAHGIKEQA